MIPADAPIGAKLRCVDAEVDWSLGLSLLRRGAVYTLAGMHDVHGAAVGVRLVELEWWHRALDVSFRPSRFELLEDPAAPSAEPPPGCDAAESDPSRRDPFPRDLASRIWPWLAVAAFGAACFAAVRLLP
jgi:hypothetical protein